MSIAAAGGSRAASGGSRAASDGGRPPLGADLTIDELAREIGMTARNIRAHQSRGLLPPPAVRGRTGFYGPDHVSRLELIKELQDEGFNLELIRRMIDSADGSSSEVLRFTRALRTPFSDEQPAIVKAEDLAERYRSTDTRLLKRAVELGLLRDLGDGTYEEVSPRLLEAGQALLSVGLDPMKAMDIFADIRRHADAISKSYVKIFMESVWKPFDRAGRPEERWPEVRDALERLRPMAAQSVLAIFQLAMDDASGKAFGRELERIEKRT